MSSTNFHNQEDGQSDLCDEDRGDAQGEFQVSGFVAETAHAEQDADAAAQDGGADQGALRDAPAVFSCSALVRVHKHEGCGID